MSNWLTGLALALALAGCNDAEQPSQQDAANRPLARVGTDAILSTDLTEFAMRRQGRGPSESRGNWPALLDELIEREMAADLSVELGLANNPEFQAQRTAIRQRAAMEEAALVNRYLLEHLAAQAEPSTAQVTEFYASQRARFLERRVRLDEFEFADAAAAAAGRSAILADTSATAGAVGAVRLTPLGWVSRTTQRGTVRAAIMSVSAQVPVSQVYSDGTSARVFVWREEQSNAPRPLGDVREQLVSELRAQTARAQLSEAFAAARKRVVVDEVVLREFVAEQPAPQAPERLRVNVPLRADDAERAARGGH